MDCFICLVVWSVVRRGEKHEGEEREGEKKKEKEGDRTKEKRQGGEAET